MKFRDVVLGALATAVLAGISLEPQTASAAKAAGSWLVLTSDRDGTDRGYAIRPDGSRLTPLLRPGRPYLPQAVSADGRTLAYGGGFVSRADGRHLRRPVKAGWLALSRDGRMVVSVEDDGLWVGDVNGRHRRRLLRGRYIFDPSFSPDAKAVAYTASVGDDEYVFVHPLNGRRRRLARGRRPMWSPDGRWIAYGGSYGDSGALYVARAHGAGRQRVGGNASDYSWSPDGKELAFGGDALNLVGLSGRAPRRLNTRGMGASYPIWAPDGRRLFVTLDRQLWSIERDGRGLRRLTGAGTNIAVGWTRLAPARPAAKALPRAERPLGPRMVATSTPVTDLSADGPRAAFVTESAIDCDHPAVWRPAGKAIARFEFPHLCLPVSTGSGIYGLELAGTRAAWVEYGGGNTWEFALRTATIDSRRPVRLSYESDDAGTYWPFHLRGDGNVVVFNDGERLVRVGSGRERCQEKGADAKVCTTIRRKDHATPIESVSGQLIAIREPTAVAVVDIEGTVMRVFPLTVTAARLDGDHLVVTRGAVLERYSLDTGALEASRSIPRGYTLVDVDVGVAVFRRAGAIRLIRIDDGRSVEIERRGPMFADLEGPGLYYSYAVGKTGRVVFVPRDELRFT